MQWDIVKSDYWLNLKLEDGLDGGSSDEHLNKIRILAIASPNHISKNPDHLRMMRASFNKPIDHMKRMRDASIASPNHISKNLELLSKGGKASVASPDHLSKNPDHMKMMRMKSINSENHNSHKFLICSHCQKEGKGAVMYRWHFDNCKMKLNNL